MIAQARPQTKAPEPKLRSYHLRKFTKSILTVVRRRTKPKPGQALKKLGKDIMKFQKHVISGKRPKGMLRQELDTLQKKITDVLNKEKYVLAMQEKEQKMLTGMQERVEAISTSLETPKISKIKSRRLTNNKKKVKKVKKRRKLSKIKVHPKYTVAKLERALKQAEKQYKKYAKNPKFPKNSIKKLGHMISAYKTRIALIKKKVKKNK